MASRELVQALRERALNAGHGITLSLDDSQAWPAILTYADTIEADGLAEADAEKRADAMIEEVFAAWASPVATWANSRSATNLAIMST